MTGNADLTSFDLSALTSVGDYLRVKYNDALTSFDLSGLTEVGGKLNVYDNGALAQCLVDAFLVQVKVGDGSGEAIGVFNNNDSCTCEEVEGVLEATCPP